MGNYMPQECYFCKHNGNCADFTACHAIYAGRELIARTCFEPENKRTMRLGRQRVLEQAEQARQEAIRGVQQLQDMYA